MEDEFLTSIDYYEKFHVNLLFGRSIYRPMCTHMGNEEKLHKLSSSSRFSLNTLSYESLRTSLHLRELTLKPF